MKIRTMSLFAAVALVGCGGGEGGAPTTATGGTVSPSTPPTTVTAPAGNPATLTFLTLAVAAEDTTGGGRQVIDAEDGEKSVFTVIDPDAPNATRIEDVNFDGDETLRATLSTAIANFSEQLLATDFTTTGSNQYYDRSLRVRSVPGALWQSRLGSSNSAILILRNLEEVRKTPAAAPTTGNITESVRLFDMRVNGRRGIQLIGSRATAMPSTGQMTFVGEVYGNFVRTGGNPDEFVGDAVITVDFARGTATGQIDFSQTTSSSLQAPTVRITFAATISANTFVAQSVTATGFDTTQSGTLRGAFYGANADELGLVLSTSGASGNVIAGLVAGRE